MLEHNMVGQYFLLASKAFLAAKFIFLLYLLNIVEFDQKIIRMTISLNILSDSLYFLGLTAQVFNQQTARARGRILVACFKDLVSVPLHYNIVHWFLWRLLNISLYNLFVQPPVEPI